MRKSRLLVIFLVLILGMYLVGRGKKEKSCSLEANQSPQKLLFCGAKNGDLLIVKKAIEKGGDVNARDFGDEIPLHEAARKGHLEVVKYLIEQGAEAIVLGCTEVPLVLRQKDFDVQINRVVLKDSARRKFIEAFQNRLEETIEHRSLKRKVSYKHLLKLECYKLQKDSHFS